MEQVPGGIFWSAEPWREVGPGALADHYDFVIVGGGLTGLWAAWHIIDREPNASVAVLEAEHVGHGASGRAGGVLTGGHNYSDMAATGELERVRQWVRAEHQTQETVIRHIVELGIECDFVPGDVMNVSTHPDFDSRIDRDIAMASKLGVSLKRLEADELQRRIASPLLTVGFGQPGGVVNPLKYTRGLAAAVASRGVFIFERTPVKAVRPVGAGCEVVTSTRRVRADRVMLARNAWAAHESPFRPTVLPVYHNQAVTAPLTDRQWAELGWEGGESVSDRRLIHVNFRRTADGRVLCGGRQLVQPFANRISPRYDASQRMARLIRQSFEGLFPQLRRVPFEKTWGGMIALTPDRKPKVGLRHEGRVAFAHGCNGGPGLTQTHLWAGAAVDLLFGEMSERASLPFTENLELRYPPEPFRWLGSKAALTSFQFHDDAIQAGLKGDSEPPLLRLVDWVLNPGARRRRRRR